MEDVIGQGREPEHGPRPPLPKSWRIAGGMVVVVAAGVAVGVLAPRHVGIAPAPAGAPAQSASSAPSASSVPSASLAQAPVPGRAVGGTLPLPQNHPAMVICAPSTGVCSMRGNGQAITVTTISSNGDRVAQAVPVP